MEKAARSHLIWILHVRSTVLCWLLWSTKVATGLSTTPSNNNPIFSSLFDRFTPSCPADFETVRKFDPTLVRRADAHDDDDGSDNYDDASQRTTSSCWWVAVHRTANNKPSVFVRDEFLNAMRSATTDMYSVYTMIPPTSLSPSHKLEDGAFVKKKKKKPSSNDDDLGVGGVGGTRSGNSTPVAVARLYQPKNSNHFLLDSMRCVLKKEETDASCDGSSEHAEALCVAIDALLEHYLESQEHFEGAIRTKATLVAAPLLESRGFVPVQSLSSDMASHVSSLDQCLSSYAARAVATSKTPAARQRAINIVSRLGRIDRAADLRERRRRDDVADSASTSNDDDYDPWRGMRQFI